MLQIFVFLFIFIANYSAVCVAQLQSLIPLSPSKNAFQRGNAASSIVVEYFIDLTCSSCLDSWPMMNEVVAAYGRSVNFLYRLYPLPYHQQAFIVNKAAQAVYFYQPESVFTFMDTAYANQALIYNSATADMSYNEVKKLVSSWATNGTGVTEEQYYRGMGWAEGTGTPDGQTIEMNARYMFKYCSLHQTFATPWYAVNGLGAMGLDTFADWQAALDPLVAAAAAAVEL